MLSAGAKFRAESKQTQRRAARPTRRGDLQSDTRYGLPARLMDLILELAYDLGHAFGGQEFAAERLHVLTADGKPDIKKVARAYKRLERLGLISAINGDIYPLPRLADGRNPTKQDFRAWLDHWLGRPGTDFNYRTVRYIRDRSFRGKPVALSYNDIAAALGAEHLQQAQRAVGIGEQRRWIRRVGRGKRSANLYEPVPDPLDDVGPAGFKPDSARFNPDGNTRMPARAERDERRMVLDGLEQLHRSKR
jgi:hypothetical protein